MEFWRQLYKNRSSGKLILSKRKGLSGNHILLKIVSENRFPGRPILCNWSLDAAVEQAHLGVDQPVAPAVRVVVQVLLPLLVLVHLEGIVLN